MSVKRKNYSKQFKLDAIHIYGVGEGARTLNHLIHSCDWGWMSIP